MDEMKRAEIMKSFERNALGRLVTNSETVQGLPITTRDSLEHLSMDDQITLLTNRLAEIGGEKYRAAEFEFDEGPSWPGFTKGNTWNGWACPYFTKEVAMNVLDWMGESNTEDEALTYEETENTITIIQTGYDTEPYTIEANEDGLYNLGGCWTWSEKTYYCALCGQTYDPKDSGAVGEFCTQYCKDEAEFNVSEQETYNRECKVKEYNTIIKDACDWLCERSDRTNCNYFLSPNPEAGPYAIIHFMEADVNVEMISTELNHNFGDTLTFNHQDAHTITIWTKE